MTQDVVPSFGERPAMDVIFRCIGQAKEPGFLQVVQGLQVLLNYAGVDEIQVEEHGNTEVVLRLEREGVVTSLWLRPLEREVSDAAVFPLMVGAKFMACKPSATPYPECEITFVYLPSTISTQTLVEYAFGAVTYPQVEAIQNFSAEYAMSGPIARFPSSVLIMLMASNPSVDQPGRVYFKLWHQNQNQAQLVELEATDSPFVAAEQARELGYSPTIYRCHSGCYVPFLPTSGFDFL
ncbi:TPA: hypothetical protein ACP32N_005123 [Pseudomonas aeruginosa]